MTSTILVVDDEPDLESLMLQRFRRKIRAGELSFLFARNGLEALGRLREHPEVDVVLTDINMPEMDGLTLLGKLTDFGPALKAVVVSAYGDLPNIRTAMNRGAFDFLTKPIDFTDLEVTVDKTLTQVELIKQADRARSELHAIEEELELAGSLQKSILPVVFPHEPDHVLHARMIPAKEIGGDFYDFFRLDDQRLGLVIADVSGKGITAAMFMAVARTLLRFTALQGMAVGHCLAHVNNLLCVDNEAMMFVTTFYGILEHGSGRFTYSNGGHNPPYRMAASGTVQALPLTGGMALGLMEGVSYDSREISLHAGDSLLLYTDGVTEAMRESGELYDDARLERLLAAHGGSEPRELLEAIVDDVKTFAEGAPQSDDITLLAVRYLGPRQASS